VLRAVRQIMHLARARDAPLPPSKPPSILSESMELGMRLNGIYADTPHAAVSM
jgi:hypothetical protein